VSLARSFLFWLEKHGISATDELVERVFSRAKHADRWLTDMEIQEICGQAAY
jgi:hypothetical protein